MHLFDKNYRCTKCGELAYSIMDKPELALRLECIPFLTKIVQSYNKSLKTKPQFSGSV